MQRLSREVIAVVIHIVLLFFYLRSYKLFDVYENKLVVRFPKALFLKNQVIDFSLVKRIIFKYGHRGANHLMIIVYNNKKVKYRFSEQRGLDLGKIFDLLRSKGVEIEVDKAWDD